MSVLNTFKASQLFALCTCVVAIGVWGCVGRSVESYKPSTDAARKAIETALTTWKEGTKHGPITSVKPNLDVFDSRWQAGSKLESFEILEEVTGKPEPHYKVKLKLAGKPEETTEYLVVGIDPLNIFRQADYDKATGM